MLQVQSHAVREVPSIRADGLHRAARRLCKCGRGDPDKARIGSGMDVVHREDQLRDDRTQIRRNRQGSESTQAIVPRVDLRDHELIRAETSSLVWRRRSFGAATLEFSRSLSDALDVAHAR